MTQVLIPLHLQLQNIEERCREGGMLRVPMMMEIRASQLRPLHHPTPRDQILIMVARTQQAQGILQAETGSTNGEIDPKICPVTENGIASDASVHGYDQVLDDRQAQPT